MQVRQLITVGFALAACGCSTLTPPATPGSAAPATKLMRSGSSGVLTTLYSFRGQPDGANPTGIVSAYNFGSCCGTTILGNTSSGGANNAGTIYMLFAPNKTSFTEYKLLNYTPSVDGSGPTGVVAELRFFTHIFGTAPKGGLHDKGTVVELRGSQSGKYYREVAVHSFARHDGALPSAGLTHIHGPVLYATTFSGGRYNRGAIVSIEDVKQQLVTRVLYSFSGAGDGEHPNSAVSSTSAVGSPYFGTTATSKSDRGTVYAFSPGQGLKTLYTFKSSTDGETPDGVLPLAYSTREVDVFGTTRQGGSSGYGTLYELKPNGSSYAKVTLHTFAGGSADGAYPYGLFFYGSKLYGTTREGGSGGCGTIFSHDTSSHSYAVRYSFTCGDDGAYPCAPLTNLSGIAFYGTTSAGGSANKGTVFSFNAYP